MDTIRPTKDLIYKFVAVHNAKVSNYNADHALYGWNADRLEFLKYSDVCAEVEKMEATDFEAFNRVFNPIYTEYMDKVQSVVMPELEKLLGEPELEDVE